MNEVGLAFVLGICSGIAITLLITVNICNNDLKKIKKLQREFIKQEKENLRLRNLIETIEEGNEEDGR